MILHQIERLAQAGVKDIVLAVNYRPEIMQARMKQYEEELGVKITFSVETEPLGTGTRFLLMIMRLISLSSWPSGSCTRYTRKGQ